MKTFFSRQVLATSVALLVGLGVSSSAWAFSVSGALGFSAVATDIVQFTCPATAARAQGIIVDTAPAVAPLLRLGLFKPALMATVQAAQEGVSPLGVRVGGPGIYWAIISKTAAGSETYTARIDCVTAAGAIVLPVGAPILTQNQ